MVLEEATIPQEPSPSSFSQSPPSNDADPYMGDRNPTLLENIDPSYPPGGPDPVYLNVDAYPMPWFLPRTTRSRQSLAKIINNACNTASRGVGRPIRQEEADAFAFHLIKSLSISAYGMPLGIGSAAILAYRGRATYRFPGWTPGDKWRARGYPDVFWFLTGSLSRRTWHVARFGAYAVVGSIIGQIFMSGYATSVTTVGMKLDPRLKEIREKFNPDAMRRAVAMPGGREPDMTAGPRDGETLNMARQRQRAQQGWKRSRQEQPDDMSPTGGAFGSEFPVAGSGEDTSMLSDAQVAQGEYQRQVRQSQSSETSDHQGEPSRPQGGESVKQTNGAWGRLRQQAASSSGNPPSSKNAQASTSPASSGDSFYFSHDEQDRQLAKHEAQRQFDSSIEQEREGRDFDDRRPGQGGWRR